MIETATLRTIVLVLFGMALIWLIKIIVKQEFETLVRALLVLVLFGGAFLFLQQTKLEKISWRGVKQELFPARDQVYEYKINESTRDGYKVVQYFFSEPGPKLNLKLDADGKNLHITDIEPVNKVLSSLGLPLIESGARELSSATGRLTDVNIYRWEDYERGVLILERGIGRNKDGLESFPCIVRLTIQYGP